jgi:hypothetical protein
MKLSASKEKKNMVITKSKDKTSILDLFESN